MQGNPIARLVSETVVVSSKLDDGGKGMSLEDVPCGHVVPAEIVASEGGLWLGIVLRSAQPFLPIFRSWDSS